ncbi:hypothetical protein LX87_05645 [Larkinella arboricola]|uniref:Outer membrane protein with beta-barrel domain n=1 Tax=Larkinella arboricola TaxID=643671 RepID=A0A327WFH9_LARAB|nr:hypothetical protein [Larkinella arboricola]RAJ89876.1 hypothetical protein LX87_05645 [Larkinella arboricola]
MKPIAILFLVQLWAFTSNAQRPFTKSSIRAGLDLMTLDAPDAKDVRYQVRYTKHLFKDRLLIGASIGYFQQNSRKNLYQDIYIDGNKRRRITTDLTLLVDLLPSAKYALRLGGGLSSWYRKDNLWVGSSFSIRPGEPGIFDLKTDREGIREWNIGPHFALEYEQAIANRFAISGRVGWADLQRASISYQVGVGISYWLY